MVPWLIHGLVILLSIDRPTLVFNASNRSHIAVVAGRHSSSVPSSNLFRFREVVVHAEEGAKEYHENFYFDLLSENISCPAKRPDMNSTVDALDPHECARKSKHSSCPTGNPTITNSACLSYINGHSHDDQGLKGVEDPVGQGRQLVGV